MNTDDQVPSVAVAPVEAPSKPAKPGGHGNVHPQAALKHGAYSAEVTGPIRERHLARLRERFPAIDPTALSIQATRLAQLEVIGVWLDGKGSLIRNQRSGTIWGPAEYWNRVASAYERQEERLEALQREAGSKPGSALAAIEADATEGER